MRPEDLLKEMVDIDSATPNITGVNRIQGILERELGSFGFEFERMENPLETQKSGYFLIATLKGQTDDYISFVSHADTVLGLDVYGPFKRIDDKRAKGSGVIDNKGGLVVAVEGLRLYLERLRARQAERPRFSLRFLSSPNEEGGSLGFHDAYRALARDSKIVLGFEPALDDGSIIESRRGNRWYQVKVTGQEAHAGRCKGEQINAAHDLSLKIVALNKLNDMKKGIAVNVGQIQAGRDRFNVVCGEANAKIDARFATFASRNDLHRRIKKILLTPAVKSPVTGRAAETSFTIVDDCPPFSSTPLSRRLVARYLEVLKDVEGRTVSAQKAGGAGDVNHMSREGVAVFDGLGPIGGHMHTIEEFIHLPSLSSRAQALASFLEEADRESIGKKRRFFGFRRKT